MQPASGLRDTTRSQPSIQIELKEVSALRGNKSEILHQQQITLCTYERHEHRGAVRSSELFKMMQKAQRTQILYSLRARRALSRGSNEGAYCAMAAELTAQLQMLNFWS